MMLSGKFAWPIFRINFHFSQSVTLISFPPRNFSQAFETRNTLGSQRSSLAGANSGLAGIASNIPSFGRLIDGIQRKKYKESLVVALFVAVLICFTLWWLLR